MLTELVFLLSTIFSDQGVDFREIIQDNPNLQHCNISFPMFDASGKLPTGISSGNLLDMGNFDQCINIEETANNSQTINGQYCLVKFHLPPELLNSTGRSNVFGNFVDLKKPKLELGGVEGRVMLQTIDPTDNSSGLALGWCLPHTCPIYELTANLNKVLEEISPDLKITPLMGGMCQTKDNLKNEYSTSNILFITFLASTVFLIIISTLYDIYLHYSQKKPAHIILMAFSVKTNGKKLLSVSNNPDQLGCLHGIRFISMMWVILGHRYTASVLEPIHNIEDTGKWMVDPVNMYILNAPVAVDSFFVLSGLLVGYGFCLAKEKGVTFNIILYYIHRYLRLTPVFAVVIWFHTTIFDFFGSGPFRPLINSYKTSCEHNWWAALLYIQNYYSPTEMCVSQSWYLSIDMQLFILSPIILIPLWRWPKKTMIASLILVLASMAASFAITYTKDLGAFITDKGVDGSGQSYMSSYYLTTHTRFGPWLMGLMLGHYLFKLRKNKHNDISLHPAEVAFGWIVGMTLLLSTLYGGHDLFLNENKLGNSFFNGLHRHGWSLGLCWVIYACTQGYGGPVNAFLSWSFFQIMARFTYTAYLVHYSFQYFMIGSSKTITRFSYFHTMNDFWGDIIFSFAIGFCLTLAYESPMITIEKVLFKTGRKSTKTELPIHNRPDSDGSRTNKGFQ